MCTNMLKAFPVGTKDNGKADLKIFPYYVNNIGLNSNGTWQACDIDSPFFRDIKSVFFNIPCGHCSECRSSQARAKAQNGVLQTLETPLSCFVTLTYDDEHIHRNDNGIPTLCRRDIQLFIKRLRKSLDPLKIKVQMSGEYGSVSFRPHYHLIIYNYRPSDLKFYSSEGFNQYFTSKTLSDMWRYGNVLVSDVTANSIAYTVGYVSKKMTDGITKKRASELDIEPEFRHSSGNIGKTWYDSHLLDLYEYDIVPVILPDGSSFDCKPTSYTDDKLAKIDEKKLLKAKLERSINIDDNADVLIKTSGVDLFAESVMRRRGEKSGIY